MDEKIKDLMPFYALGTLDEQEISEVDAYLENDFELREQLDLDMLTASALAFQAEPIEPPRRLKQNLMAKVQADVAQAPQPKKVEEPVGLSRFFSFFRQDSLGFAMPLLAGASLAVAVIAGAWVFSLNNQVNQLRAEMASLNDSISPIQSEMQGKVTPLEEEIATLQEENAILQEALQVQREAIAQFNAEITSLHTENVSLQEGMTNQGNTIAEMSGSLTEIDNDLNLLPEQLETLATLKDEIGEQSQLLSEQEASVAALNQEVLTLQALNTQLLTDLSSQKEIMVHATLPEVETRVILGTDDLPGARGHLVGDPANTSAAVIIAGLPPLEPGFEYQFWFVEAGQYVQAGSLEVDAEGLGTLITAPGNQINNFEAMGVSVEAVDQTPVPTLESMIMLGNLSS